MNQNSRKEPSADRLHRCPRHIRLRTCPRPCPSGRCSWRRGSCRRRLRSRPRPRCAGPRWPPEHSCPGRKKPEEEEEEAMGQSTTKTWRSTPLILDWLVGLVQLRVENSAAVFDPWGVYDIWCHVSLRLDLGVCFVLFACYRFYIYVLFAFIQSGLQWNHVVWIIKEKVGYRHRPTGTQWLLGIERHFNFIPSI